MESDSTPPSPLQIIESPKSEWYIPNVIEVECECEPPANVFTDQQVTIVSGVGLQTIPVSVNDVISDKESNPLEINQVDECVTVITNNSNNNNTPCLTRITSPKKLAFDRDLEYNFTSESEKLNVEASEELVTNTVPVPMDLHVVVDGEELCCEERGVSTNNLSEEHVSYYWNYELETTHQPVCLGTTGKTEFQSGEYMRGCKWAPDGSCLLTNSDDGFMRIFNLPTSFYGIQDWKTFDEKDENWNSVLKIKEGGLVYDYCWYPLMSSMDPVSSCFLTTATDSPIHLWDAFTGKLRCTYRAYNQVDEVTPAYCVAFDPAGEYIYCGFEKTIRIFNISRPGRQCTERKLKHRDFPSLTQTGIISCIAVSPSRPSLYACGSFRNTIGLYLEDGTVLCVLDGHFGGLTHLKFSQDGTKLFSGGRKDSRLICWDIRNLGDTYQIFNRKVETNQRIYFDTTLNDRYLVSGGTDGTVLIWDLLANSEKQNNDCSTFQFEASSDCINGVSLNPFIPVLATASGQRHFKDIAEDSNDEMFVDSELTQRKEYGVRLWKFL